MTGIELTHIPYDVSMVFANLTDIGGSSGQAK